MLALDAKGLVKRFATTTALDGVDISMTAGEVRGLLGLNGAGKTTLLRILFGLIHPDAGRVELLDNAPGDLHGVAGFVEDPCFYPYLSGRANLELLARLDGGGSASVDDALERVDMLSRGDERVHGYSTGMRQRLGIAAALLRKPRLLLLDEPTSGLDPAGARAVCSLVSDLARDGVAVLVSSHQIGELELICDSYTMLRHGSVAWQGTTAELESAGAYSLRTSDDERAMELIAGRVQVQQRPGDGIVVYSTQAALDELTIALGEARVAIRRLELLVTPLESMFSSMTEAIEPHALPDRVLAAALA